MEELIQQLKDLNAYNPLCKNLSEKDIKRIIEYASLGQEVDSYWRNYEIVKDSVGEYLGALYVGCSPDDTILLACVSSWSKEGLGSSVKIDKLKQVAAYRYLFHKAIDDPVPKDVRTLIMRYYQQFVDEDNMSEQEIQFWWELIPSDRYSGDGEDKRVDLMCYYPK